MAKEFIAPVTVGDEVFVEFMKNSGSRPVCRVNGKVGFIDKEYKGFIAPCSSWMVRVERVQANMVFVTPIIETHTAKENIEAFNAKMEALKSSKDSKPVKGKEFTSKFIL